MGPESIYHRANARFLGISIGLEDTMPRLQFVERPMPGLRGRIRFTAMPNGAFTAPVPPYPGISPSARTAHGFKRRSEFCIGLGTKGPVARA